MGYLAGIPPETMGVFVDALEIVLTLAAAVVVVALAVVAVAVNVRG